MSQKQIDPCPALNLFRPGGKDLYPFQLRPVAGSVVRYNQDYGAQLIHVTEQCLNLSFFSRADALIDRVTLRH